MLYSILVGLIIFWATSKIMNFRGWGFIVNTLFVIAGSVVGKWALGALGLYAGSGMIASVISGVVGCCLVLAAIKFVNKGQ